MKSAKHLFLVLAVLLCVSLACTFLKGRTGSSPYGVKDSDISPVTSIDANSKFPAMSTDAVNALIQESPELAKYRDQILELERSAINSLVAESRAKAQASTLKADLPDSAPLGFESKYQRDDGFIGPINLIPAAYAADEAPTMPEMGGIEYFIVGYQAGFFTPDFEKARAEDRGKSKTVETKNDNGTVLATQTVSVNGDGTVSAEMTTSINMPVLGLNANSRVKITGNQCPSADGKIELTIELGTNGRSGSSGSVIYDKTLTGKLMATVNDDAELAGFDLDIKQSTRSNAGGRQVYVETTQTVQSANGTYAGMDFREPKIVRASSQATEADQTLSKKGLLNAFLLAQGILESARGRWKDGGCVKILATSPGTVDTNSTSQIPVKVVSKVDGSDVPSKLESKLTGGASIDPALIPKTDGTLTYVAPGEKGKTATISLTATSRRGRATLDLSASTGGNSYRVNGTSQGASFTGEICSLNKQFYLTVNSITGNWPMDFTPNPGNGLSGEMTGTFEGNGCTLTGGGPYSITLNSDGSGTITFTYNSTATCPGLPSKTTSRTQTLPLKPAPDLSCP